LHIACERENDENKRTAEKMISNRFFLQQINGFVLTVNNTMFVNKNGMKRPNKIINFLYDKFILKHFYSSVSLFLSSLSNKPIKKHTFSFHDSTLLLRT